MLPEDRKLIDPRGEYPAEGLRRCEEIAAQVLQFLPGASVSRTRDVIQLEHGGDGEDGIVVVVTAEALELRLPSVEWTCGSHGPASSSRLWKRVKCTDSLLHSRKRLGGHLERARAARAAEFSTCAFCGRRFSRDHMTGNACHGCGSQHLGIVY